MSWIFRKIFRLGPIRTTLSKGGIGMSWGIPGCRAGVTANGRKYITLGIPGTGFYFTKYLNQQTQNKQNFHQENSVELPFHQNKMQKTNKTEEPWWKQKNL